MKFDWGDIKNSENRNILDVSTKLLQVNEAFFPSNVSHHVQRNMILLP